MTPFQWARDYRRDVSQYTRRSGASADKAILTTPGLWALLQYRIAHQYNKYLLLKPFLALWRLLVEATTGATIPSNATIGPGLHISHSSGIVISSQAVIGSDCLITHGVAVGVAGVGAARGVPTIGSRVYIGPHAAVVGQITVGDDSMIGANSVVSRDVPASAKVRPAPAIVAPLMTDDQTP